MPEELVDNSERYQPLIHTTSVGKDCGVGAFEAHYSVFSYISHNLHFGKLWRNVQVLIVQPFQLKSCTKSMANRAFRGQNSVRLTRNQCIRIRRPGVLTVQECALTRSVYYPGVCTIQECVLSRSVYYPGVCTNQECVLSRSVHYPGVCTIQEYVLSRSVHYPGVCTNQECVLSRSVYYPGVCTNQECVPTRTGCRPRVCGNKIHASREEECVHIYIFTSLFNYTFSPYRNPCIGHAFGHACPTSIVCTYTCVL